MTKEKKGAAPLSDLDPDSFVDEGFLEEKKIMAKKTAQGRRLRGEPPDYFKIGKSVRYRVGDLIAFLEKSRVETVG